jgi:hypothetical protein
LVTAGLDSPRTYVYNFKHRNAEPLESENMSKTFPKFESHNTASCFNCDGDFDGSYFSDSGNADGAGRWVQSCEKCRVSTWYDLKKRA